MSKLVLTALSGALLAVLVMAPGAWRLYHQMPSPIAVVDLIALTNEQAEAIQKGPGTTDDKTQKANAFAARLDAEVLALARDCGCVILVKAAVMAGSVQDLTARLRERLQKK